MISLAIFLFGVGLGVRIGNIGAGKCRALRRAVRRYVATYGESVSLAETIKRRMLAFGQMKGALS